jgi:hypothetical protein
MTRCCEICASRQGKPPARLSSPGKIRRVLVEERIVSLCEEHAARYRLSGCTTVSELYALFPETNGRRSLISRRAPLDRRVFPARPEGRRHNVGRRTSDYLD